MPSQIYVSGPITGVPGHVDNFHTASELLRGVGYDPLDPHDVPLCATCDCPGGHWKTDEGVADGTGNWHHGWYCALRHDIIALLENCDKIALLYGWETSKGARLERSVALQLGLDVRPLLNWFATDVVQRYAGV